MQCMKCLRWFEPLLKFQLCCSAACAEAAGRAEKEGVQVRELLRERLCRAQMDELGRKKETNGLAIRSHV